MWAYALYSRDRPAIEPNTTPAAAPAASQRLHIARAPLANLRMARQGTSGVLWAATPMPSHRASARPRLTWRLRHPPERSPPTLGAGTHPPLGEESMATSTHGLLDSPCRRRVLSPRALSCRRPSTKSDQGSARAGIRRAAPKRAASRGPRTLGAREPASPPVVH